MTLLLIVLLVFVVAGAPGWGWHAYGWTPSGIVGILLVVLLVLFLMGRL